MVMAKAFTSIPNLWSLTELQRLTDAQRGSAVPESCDAVTRLSIDSRTVQPGDLFIALPGDPGERFTATRRSSRDGIDFVASAQANGAIAALVHREVAAPIDQLLVPDTYAALWAVGAGARKRLTAPVVAITGSSGKTTAKHFLTYALDAWVPPGSLNNHIGVPLSLANADPTAAAYVFEIGTNHPGEIGPLSEMVSPDLALLLNVHSAHLENFADRAALFSEKKSIFQGLSAVNLKVSEDVLGLDSHSFGFTFDADCRIVSLHHDYADLNLFGQRLRARVPGGGSHRALTMAGTVLTVHLLGTDLARALEIPSDVIPAGRGNLIRCGDIRLWDDSYNANPESMQAALDWYIAQDTVATAGRKIAVLGEMFELGADSEAEHERIMGYVAGLDEVFWVGAAWQNTDADSTSAGKHFAAADTALMDCLIEALRPGDQVMIKGSNGVFWTSQFVEKLAAQLNEHAK